MTQSFLGTIGWIKSNLMTSSQASDKINNDNFYPGSQNIPETEPDRPDGIPPITDGLVYCFDGNNHGKSNSTWDNLIDNIAYTPKYSSAFTTDDYGTYRPFNNNDWTGLELSFTNSSIESTCIWILRKEINTSSCYPISFKDTSPTLTSLLSWPRPDNSEILATGNIFTLNASPQKNNSGIYVAIKRGESEISKDCPHFLASIIRRNNKEFTVEAHFDNMSAESAARSYSSPSSVSNRSIRVPGRFTGSSGVNCAKHLYAFYLYNRGLTEEEFIKVKQYVMSRYKLI